MPSLSAADLLETVPDLDSVARVEAVEYGNVPSSHVNPSLMLDLAGTVEELLNRNDIDGVVLTHGTDTMEETAYFFDLWIESPKPVCLTGAMRNNSDASPDGPGNILDAVRVAACDTLRGCGTMVVMNGEVHAAFLVGKMDRDAVHSFASPGWGPLGRVTAEGVTLMWKPEQRQLLRSSSPPSHRSPGQELHGHGARGLRIAAGNRA